jgi:dienelactone hydrolase
MTPARRSNRIHPLIWAIPVGFLLVCCGLPAAWVGKKISDRRPSVEDPDVVAAKPVTVDREHAVGYRRTTLRFTPPGGEERTRQLDLWYPTSDKERRHDYKGQIGSAAEDGAVAKGPFPLLLFSHGFLGGSDQSIFHTEACARAGYIVASMNHADAGTAKGPKPDPKFLDAGNWTDAKYRDRKEDLVALLDQMLAWNGTKGSPWEGRIDVKRVGAMGHSLGGYTVLGLVGGWPKWKDDRIRAAVLFSPFAQPFPARGDLPKVKVPVQMQGGTLDFGITPFLPPAYDKLGGPRAFLVLKNEMHFGWTNLISLGKTTKEAVTRGNAELMVRYTIAWFDQFLVGADRKAILKKGDAALESYKVDLRE